MLNVHEFKRKVSPFSTLYKDFLCSVTPWHFQFCICFLLLEKADVLHGSQWKVSTTWVSWSIRQKWQRCLHPHKKSCLWFGFKHPISASQCCLTRAEIKWQARQQQKINNLCIICFFLKQLQQLVYVWLKYDCSIICNHMSLLWKDWYCTRWEKKQWI